MIDPALRRSILEIRSLPTLPEVVTKILGSLEDETSSAADVGELLEMDHAIAARVLRVANSAFYGLTRNVDSVRRAVVVIGFEGVRLLALATSVYDSLSRTAQKVLEPRDFWMHSLGAARAASLLAHSKGGLASAEAYFTAGLLHDLGKYVLAVAFGAKYGEVLESARVSGTPLAQVERLSLRTTHSEVGAWIAQRWQFPQALVVVLAQLGDYRTYGGTRCRDVRSVALAEQLSCLAGFGLGGSAPFAAPDPWLLQTLSISDQQLSSLLEQVRQARDDAERLLCQLREG